MNKQHPLKKARWIWPIHINNIVPDTHAQFRYDFELSRVPRKAPFFISADQCYVLYVNGQYVTRGPARGYQESWPFDEVDLMAYLREGHNWISIRAYNAGISTFQYLHQSAAGVICAAEWGRTKIYTNHDWLTRLAPGYRQNTARLSMQLNYQECLDARCDDGKWITAARCSRKGWQAPLGVMAYGAMPWHAMEVRGVPNQTNDILPYQQVVSAAQGKCDHGWDEETNLYRPVYNEVQQVPWSECARGKLLDDGLKFTVDEAGKGSFSAVVADLGKPGVGTLIVEASGASGGEVVDFFFTEGIRYEGRPVVGPDLRSGCRAAFVARLTLRKGKTRHEFLHMMGHRFVIAIARETEAPIRLKLALRQTVYPMEHIGSFCCDDPVLNDIHRISMQTQRVCALDAYVDTPWREQAQWWGDARVQAQNTFHICGDTRLVKRGIRSIAQQEVPNGLTYGHAPTRAHNCILPDFSLIWALTIWDCYFQTGDISLFEEQWGRIQKLLGYFENESKAANGLLAYDPRYWLFLDWANIQKTGTPALLNLWYLLTLDRLATMAKVAGMAAERKQLAAMCRRQKRAVEKLLWNEREGLFVDGLDERGKAVRRYSVHTQTLAMHCGLKKRFHPQMIRKRLLPYLHGQKMDSALPTSYWATYVYEVMLEAGYGADVLSHLRHNWQPMIPMEGTLEVFLHPQDKGNGEAFVPGHESMTHAWSAHPIYHLVRILGGVVQTDVAWNRIRFAPQLEARNVGQANVTVPTPKGIIKTRWNKRKDGQYDVKLDLPKGISADICLPGQASQTVTGRNRFRIELP